MVGESESMEMIGVTSFLTKAMTPPTCAIRAVPAGHALVAGKRRSLN